MSWIKELFSTSIVASDIKIDAATSKILDLTAKRKSLEIDIEQAELKLANSKQAQNMEMENQKHYHRLELSEANAELTRAKKIFKEDSERLTVKMKKEHEIETNELTSLLKIEATQKEAQLNLNHERALDRIKNENEEMINKINTENITSMASFKTSQAESMATIKSDLAKDYYDKMQSAMEDLNKNGSNATKFTQELALKMMEKGPIPQTFQMKTITEEIK